MLRDPLVKEIRTYLQDVSLESRVFIGCDSKRYRNAQGEWMASYTTAICIHVDNRRGCKVFTDHVAMRDYDQRDDRPAMRMMQEAYHAVEAYQQLEDDLILRDTEVHLDVNADPSHGSNCALAMTTGYVKGVTGLVVRVKPDAFAASYAADRGVNGGYARSA